MVGVGDGVVGFVYELVDVVGVVGCVVEDLGFGCCG